MVDDFSNFKNALKEIGDIFDHKLIIEDNEEGKALAKNLKELTNNFNIYFVNNSAETSTMQASWNFLNSIGDKDIIALTKTSYWERKHKKIPKEVFKNEQVKSVANCKACHSDIEKAERITGLLAY